jgi:hypothetical protein
MKRPILLHLNGQIVAAHRYSNPYRPAPQTKRSPLAPARRSRAIIDPTAWPGSGEETGRSSWPKRLAGDAVVAMSGLAAGVLVMCALGAQRVYYQRQVHQIGTRLATGEKQLRQSLADRSLDRAAQAAQLARGAPGPQAVPVTAVVRPTPKPLTKI